jgi:hypothetical protein
VLCCAVLWLQQRQQPRCVSGLTTNCYCVPHSAKQRAWSVSCMQAHW